MGSTSDWFPRDLLKSEDLERPDALGTFDEWGPLTIVTAGKEKLAFSDDPQPVIRFKELPGGKGGKGRGLVMNVTNTRVLEKALGRDPDKWIGQQINLYVVETSYAGEVTWGLRIRMPQGYVPPAATAPAPIATPPVAAQPVVVPDPAHAPITESDIPF